MNLFLYRWGGTKAFFDYVARTHCTPSSVTFKDIMNSSPHADDIALADLRQWAMEVLSAAGILEADVDAELLIGHVLNLSRGELASKLVTGFTVSGESALAIRQLVERRAGREPLQHILGVAWFRSLTLQVGPGVFVPRPETEQLAGMAIDALRSLAEPSPSFSSFLR